MGVLVGRIGKVDEGLLRRGRNKLAAMVRGFVGATDNFGLAVVDREVEVRKNFSGNDIKGALESYGVATCEAGTAFWK